MNYLDGLVEFSRHIKDSETHINQNKTSLFLTEDAVQFTPPLCIKLSFAYSIRYIIYYSHVCNKDKRGESLNKKS